MILPRVMSLHCVSQCALIWIIANALHFRNASITNINNRWRTPPQFTTKVLFLGDITRWRRLSCLFSIPCSLYYYSVNCLGAQCHCQLICFSINTTRAVVDIKFQCTPIRAFSCTSHVGVVYLLLGPILSLTTDQYSINKYKRPLHLFL